MVLLWSNLYVVGWDSLLATGCDAVFCIIFCYAEGHRGNSPALPWADFSIQYYIFQRLSESGSRTHHSSHAHVLEQENLDRSRYGWFLARSWRVNAAALRTSVTHIAYIGHSRMTLCENLVRTGETLVDTFLRSLWRMSNDCRENVYEKQNFVFQFNLIWSVCQVTGKSHIVPCFLHTL